MKDQTNISCIGCGGGFGLGNIIAAVVSYIHWHSIWWAILHTFLGWIYLIYYLIAYGWH